MGILDKIKGFVGGNADKLDEGIDKAADTAKDKLGEKHRDKVESVAEKAHGAVDKLEGDDVGGGDVGGDSDGPAGTAGGGTTPT